LVTPWRARWRSVTDTFSEFTYSFALVNELVTLGDPPIVSVPVFPSLIQEGRATGGYDVALDRPGRPLFLQFKLSKHIRGRRAREFQQNLFGSPLYRMYIRARRSSLQHELLLELERTNQGSVYYCGPAFHTLMELNIHYKARQIARYSRFVKPSELPPVNDDEEHWLSFREARGGPVAFFSPEGTKIEVDERPVLDRLHEDLMRSEGVPLRTTITNLATWLTNLAGRDATRAIAEEDVTRPEDAFARVALLSHTQLNSTFCILQPRVLQGAESQ
jgi:hypothetical protein